MAPKSPRKISNLISISKSQKTSPKSISSIVNKTIVNKSTINKLTNNTKPTKPVVNDKSEMTVNNDKQTKLNIGEQITKLVNNDKSEMTVNNKYINDNNSDLIEFDSDSESSSDDESKSKNKCLRMHEIPTGNYIYLIQEREFVRTGESIFKIGKTTQRLYKRMSQYPKSSMALLSVIVDDCHTAEKDLLKLFHKKYIHRSEIGAESFEGDPAEMMKDIVEYQSTHFHRDRYFENNNKYFEKQLKKAVKKAKGQQVSDSSDEQIECADIDEPIEKPVVKQKLINSSRNRSKSVAKTITKTKNIIDNEQYQSSINKIMDEVVNILNVIKTAEVFIHTTTTEKPKILEVDYIDVIDSKTKDIIEKFDIKNNTNNEKGIYEHKYLKLTATQFGKYTKIFKPKHNKYIIKICSMKLQTCQSTKYYKNEFIIDESIENKQ